MSTPKPVTVALIDGGPLEDRRRCECCDFPTLVIYDKDDPGFRWDLTPTSCDLCEWDSRPLDVNGKVDASSASDEERNDGLTLESAKANFARFSSVYDPNDPPGWKVSPPNDEIVALRTELHEALAHALSHARDPGFDRWTRVRECERSLSAALAAQRTRDQELTQRDADEGGLFDDTPEWNDRPERPVRAPADARATYVRLYTDENGESRFEKLAHYLSPTDFAPPAPPLFAAPFLPTAQSFWVGAPSGWDGEAPHPSPRRQIFCVLQGDFRIATSTGDVRYFSPGDVILLEDTWGKGHSTRITSTQDVLVFAVALAETTE